MAGGRLSGESGIRTHGDISATLDFESSALDQLSHLSLRYCRLNGGQIVPFSRSSVKQFLVYELISMMFTGRKNG